jgi:secondary thiamine-phosphate synthase enzyme
MVENFNFQIKTNGFNDIVDVTRNVMEFIKTGKVKNGNALVFSPGSTCGITTTEFEPGTVEDLKTFYNSIIPMDKNYKHNLTWGDGNGFSHLRAALTKSFFMFPVIDKKPVLGTWQQIVLIDFDNKSRTRQVFVQLSGE